MINGGWRHYESSLIYSQPRTRFVWINFVVQSNHAELQKNSISFPHFFLLFSIFFLYFFREFFRKKNIIIFEKLFFLEKIKSEKMVSKTKSNVDKVQDVEDTGKVCCLCANDIRVWAIGNCKHPGKRDKMSIFLGRNIEFLIKNFRHYSRIELKLRTLLRWNFFFGSKFLIDVCFGSKIFDSTFLTHFFDRKFWKDFFGRKSVLTIEKGHIRSDVFEPKFWNFNWKFFEWFFDRTFLNDFFIWTKHFDLKFLNSIFCSNFDHRKFWIKLQFFNDFCFWSRIFEISIENF